MKVGFRHRIIRAFGVLVLAVGILVGMAFSAAGIVGDYEATRFDSSLSLLRDASLKTFHCPMAITRGETGTVTASFKNTLDYPTIITVRSHISNYLTLTTESTDRLSLEPGESKKLEWTVTADDVLYGNLILVKVLQFRQYPMPSRLGSCGILVLDVPFLKGWQIVALAFATSVATMVGGIGLWVVAQRPLSRRGRQSAHTLAALAASVVVGMVASYLGAWLLGLIVFVVSILLAGAIIGYFVNGPVTS